MNCQSYPCDWVRWYTGGESLLALNSCCIFCEGVLLKHKIWKSFLKAGLTALQSIWWCRCGKTQRLILASRIFWVISWTISHWCRSLRVEHWARVYSSSMFAACSWIAFESSWVIYQGSMRWLTNDLQATLQMSWRRGCHLGIGDARSLAEKCCCSYSFK